MEYISAFWSRVIHAQEKKQHVPHSQYFQSNSVHKMHLETAILEIRENLNAITKNM